MMKEIKMPPNFYFALTDHSFQAMIFNDDPDVTLPWSETYYAILRKYFGKPFDADFPGFKVERNPDSRKRKKGGDIFGISASSVLIVSDRALDALGEDFNKAGQVIKIISSMKGYQAFHVTDVVKNAVVWEKSKYTDITNGKLLYSPFLNEKALAGKDIFMIEEDIAVIYLSNEFRNKYEKAKLTGLNFSEISYIKSA